MTQKKSKKTESGVITNCDETDNAQQFEVQKFHLIDIDIKSLIQNVRGQKVMIDRDLALLYGVETKRLNEAVRRNKQRFEGEDFMFRLTKEELANISSRSQIATLNKGRGTNVKYQPYVFTELGVAMLSSVLRSETAISINRDIMRAFVSFRHLAIQPLPDSNAELRQEIQALRDEMSEILADQNDINESTRAQLDAISDALAELQSERPKTTKRNPIGFNPPKE